APTPAADSIGCSGQMPVSITPTTTLDPAALGPPSEGQTFVAPMNSVLSSCGCSSVSCCTAATPGTFSRSATEFAGTAAAPPPQAVCSACPIVALGTAASTAALISLDSLPVWAS